MLIWNVIPGQILLQGNDLGGTIRVDKVESGILLYHGTIRKVAIKAVGKIVMGIPTDQLLLRIKNASGTGPVFRIEASYVHLQESLFQLMDPMLFGLSRDYLLERLHSTLNKREGDQQKHTPFHGKGCRAQHRLLEPLLADPEGPEHRGQREPGTDQIAPALDGVNNTSISPDIEKERNDGTTEQHQAGELLNHLLMAFLRVVKVVGAFKKEESEEKAVRQQDQVPARPYALDRYTAGRMRPGKQMNRK